MTPMQVAAKAPLVVMCHEEERKQASIVYQFQSICPPPQKKPWLVYLLRQTSVMVNGLGLLARATYGDFAGGAVAHAAAVAGV